MTTDATTITTGATRRVLRTDRLSGTGLLVAGLLGVVAIVVLTLFGETLSGFELGKQDLRARLMPPLTDGHLLGTDKLGRDLFARIAAAFRWSVPVGLVSTFIAVTIGTTIGLIAGWSDGWVRAILTRLIEMAISFPYLVLAVAIITVTGHGFWALALVLGFTSWVSFARVVYAETLSIKEREYVLAARLTGVRPARIVVTYVFRGVRPTIVVMAAFIFADLLVAEAGLSFLGLGAPIGEPSWGNMLSDAREQLFDAPWMMWGPAAAVILTVVTANLIGDGLLQRAARGSAQQ